MVYARADALGGAAYEAAIASGDNAVQAVHAGRGSPVLRWPAPKAHTGVALIAARVGTVRAALSIARPAPEPHKADPAAAASASAPQAPCVDAEDDGLLAPLMQQPAQSQCQVATTAHGRVGVRIKPLAPLGGADVPPETKQHPQPSSAVNPARVAVRQGRSEAGGLFAAHPRLASVPRGYEGENP